MICLAELIVDQMELINSNNEFRRQQEPTKSEWSRIRGNRVGM